MPYRLIITSDDSKKLHLPHSDMPLKALLRMFPLWDQGFSSESGYQISVKRMASEHPAVTREAFKVVLDTNNIDKVIDLFYHEDEFHLFIRRKRFRSVYSMPGDIPREEIPDSGVTGEFVYADEYTILQQFTQEYSYEVPICNNISDTDLFALEKVLYRAFLADRDSLSSQEQRENRYISPWVYKDRVLDCLTIEEFCHKYFPRERFAEAKSDYQKITLQGMYDHLKYQGYAFISAADNITGRLVTFIPPSKNPY
jgi:hypothetical protein